MAGLFDNIFTQGGGGLFGGLTPDQLQQLQAQQQGQAPQQPMQRPAGPDFGDRLGAGFLGFANARNPMQAIGNLVQGLSTGQRSDPQGMQQQQLKATYDALVGKGVPQSEALAATLNPEVMKQVAGKYFEAKPPQFTKIGQDAMGREQFGFVDPYRQTVTPAAGAGGSQAQGNINNLMNAGLSGPDFLKAIEADQSLGKGAANTIKMMTEGKLQPPGSFALSKPYWQTMLGLAGQYEPGFDATKWSARVGTAKDFASGQAAKNVTSLNTVMGHLSDLADKAGEMNNFSVTPLNSVVNPIQSMMGDPRYKNFNLAATAVADEMAKTFRSAGMSDHEIRQWRDSISDSSSPAQFAGVFKTGIGLLESRMSALADQYNRSMGTNITGHDLLNDKAKAALTKLETWGQQAGQSEKPASPSTPQFTEGMTATNPQTGQKAVFKGGKWQIQ